MNQSDFLYHRQRYSGKVQPQNMLFNANLQEFALKVSYITSLETAGKITPEDSYRQIKKLWKELKNSKKRLGVGENFSQLDEFEQ
jgi:isopropylmalate/homocitrate/citramalate synthase